MNTTANICCEPIQAAARKLQAQLKQAGNACKYTQALHKVAIERGYASYHEYHAAALAEYKFVHLPILGTESPDISQLDAYADEVAPLWSWTVRPQTVSEDWFFDTNNERWITASSYRSADPWELVVSLYRTQAGYFIRHVEAEVFWFRIEVEHGSLPPDRMVPRSIVCRYVTGQDEFGKDKGLRLVRFGLLSPEQLKHQSASTGRFGVLVWGSDCLTAKNWASCARPVTNAEREMFDKGDGELPPSTAIAECDQWQGAFENEAAAKTWIEERHLTNAIALGMPPAKPDWDI